MPTLFACLSGPGAAGLNRPAGFLRTHRLRRLKALAGRVFAVPEAYVVSYGRYFTDGQLSDISLHALLADFTGRTPENLARFKTPGWGDRIDVMVCATRASSQNAVDWHND